MQPLVTTEPLLVSLLLGLDEIVSNDLHLRKGKWHLREGEMAFEVRGNEAITDAFDYLLLGPEHNRKQLMPVVNFQVHYIDLLYF